MNPQLLIIFSVFFFLLGACIGSFLNVVIWRLPYRGREVLYLKTHGKLTLSWPPSHCPVCDAPIHWYQNIPVLSWIALKARCANCRTNIPIRYPLVELATALTFLGFFLAYFVAGWKPGFVDIHIQYAPFLLHLTFIAALLVASAIDADLYIIPLSIPYFLVIIGLIAAIFIDHPVIPKIDPVNGWWLAKPVMGAALGVLLANLLMALKLMPRSFADHYDTESPPIPTPSDSSLPPNEPPVPPLPKLTRFAASATVSALLVLAVLLAWLLVSAHAAALMTVIAALLIFLLGVLPRDADQVDVTDEVMEEISAPHVRREAAKEIPFLLLPIVTAIIAYYLPITVPNLPWIARLLGCILGILVGGGIVWLIRVAGTLALNKEAMGMGDAHLMAGVGAILGAPLVIIAFLTAPFLGIAWAIVLKAMGKPNVLPYGPWLSLASILALLLGNPLLAWYMTLLFGGGIVGGGIR